MDDIGTQKNEGEVYTFHRSGEAIFAILEVLNNLIDEKTRNEKTGKRVSTFQKRLVIETIMVGFKDE